MGTTAGLVLHRGLVVGFIGETLAVRRTGRRGRLHTTHELSRAAILDTYYAFWSERMRAVHKLPMCTEDNCIADFVVVHWAEEIDD